MVKRSRKNQKSVPTNELVAVVFAANMDEAQDIKDMLGASDIPAVVRKQMDTDEPAIAVMVPEELMDKAQAIVESSDSYDQMFDIAAEIDEDEWQDDFLDDNY